MPVQIEVLEESSLAYLEWGTWTQASLVSRNRKHRARRPVKGEPSQVKNTALPLNGSLGLQRSYD